MNTEILDTMELECPMDQTPMDRCGNRIREGDFIIYPATARGLGKTTPVIRYARVMKIDYDTKYRLTPWRLVVRAIDDEMERMTPKAVKIRHVIAWNSQMVRISNSAVPSGYRDMVVEAEKASAASAKRGGYAPATN